MVKHLYVEPPIKSNFISIENFTEKSSIIIQEIEKRLYPNDAIFFKSSSNYNHYFQKLSFCFRGIGYWLQKNVEIVPKNSSVWLLEECNGSNISFFDPKTFSLFLIKNCNFDSSWSKKKIGRHSFILTPMFPFHEKGNFQKINLKK